MIDSIAVLGSTGSVGTQALSVADYHNIRVAGIAGNRNALMLEAQIRKYKPDYCGVADEATANDLKIRVRDTGTELIVGKDAASETAYRSDCRTVVNAVTGIAGLRPTLATIESGKDLALANKETMVAYGEQVMLEAKARNVRIMPVDSEHCAIFQCLQGNRSRDVRKILLTASGGPFYGKSRDDLRRVTASEALAHPTWNMGKRISIDSATMMNKGFEVIEALRLFELTPEQVEVVIHRESIVHSMVEYVDGAVMAQLSTPDMRLCVQYALSWPDRWESPLQQLDFAKLGSLTFKNPDNEAFPLLPVAFEAAEKGGVAPAMMNAADEEAVAMFLEGKIGFCEISEAVSAVVRGCQATKTLPTLKEVEEADTLTRERVRALLNS